MGLAIRVQMKRAKNNYGTDKGLKLCKKFLTVVNCLFLSI